MTSAACDDGSFAMCDEDLTLCQPSGRVEKPDARELASRLCSTTVLSETGGDDVGGARINGRFEVAAAEARGDCGRVVGSIGGDGAPSGGELVAAAGVAAEGALARERGAVTGALSSRALLVALAALGKVWGDCWGVADDSP